MQLYFLWIKKRMNSKVWIQIFSRHIQDRVINLAKQQIIKYNESDKQKIFAKIKYLFWHVLSSNVKKLL